MTKLDMITIACLVGAGAALLFIFTMIAITGGFLAIEPNPWILGAEVMMGPTFILVAILNAHQKLRKK
jgi:hypothetical protein